MTRRPITVSVDEPTLELVVEALKADASRRQRAAMRAAGELEADVSAGEVSDRRPAAVRITKVLAEASALVTFAERLEAGGEPPSIPPATDTELAEADDALVAEAAAELLTTAAEDLPDGYRSVLDEDETVDPQEVLR